MFMANCNMSFFACVFSVLRCWLVHECMGKPSTTLSTMFASTHTWVAHTHGWHMMCLLALAQRNEERGVIWRHISINVDGIEEESEFKRKVFHVCKAVGKSKSHICHAACCALCQGVLFFTLYPQEQPPADNLCIPLRSTVTV